MLSLLIFQKWKMKYSGGMPDSGDEKDADWTAGVCV